tara:strand:+ start:909 stop:1736 length:828 start_codon:yes stop_codon:yes gene_type:complete
MVAFMSFIQEKWGSTAFNTAPDSENQIHGDELAQEYGFEGGLVPGVTISAYLVHPAIEKWGKEWLDNGFANCRITSPLYDRESFIVQSDFIDETNANATLIRGNGVVSANAEISLIDNKPKAPIYRGDKIVDSLYKAPKAEREYWKKLESEGCFAHKFHWSEEDPLIYLRDQNKLPNLLQPKKGAYSNLAFLLGCSNWILAGNAYMNPWVHLQTISQNFKAVEINTSLIAEMEINKLFEKKGHEFVDVYVNLFEEESKECVMHINLIAIYKLRGS